MDGWEEFLAAPDNDYDLPGFPAGRNKLGVPWDKDGLLTDTSEQSNPIALATQYRDEIPKIPFSQSVRQINAA